jgi:hydroxymethylpyrimidine pyrophosphatase-like HAD family hydrolase
VLRAAYLDLDGTLLGRGASLLHDADGAFTLLGARALEACARADVEVVPYSGRRQSTMLHTARLLGVASYIFEAGSGLVLDGEVEWLTDGLEPRGDETIHEQIEASGAPALLLERYAGRLRRYEPWRFGPREVSMLFLGEGISSVEADELLSEEGFEWLRLVENGVMHGVAGTGLAYQLIPRASSKPRAVARHMQARGYAPEECIAVGDSREDLGAASVVGTFWLVANATPEVRSAAAAYANVRVAEGSHGAGVYEAVITTLAQRRVSS